MSHKENLPDTNNNNFKFQMRKINIPFSKKTDKSQNDEGKDNVSFVGKFPKGHLFKGKTSKNTLLEEDNFFKQQKKDKNKNSLILFDKEQKQAHANDHINSFSSIFKRDHEEIQGIQRVFRKSIIFFVLSIVSFAFLVTNSINLFQFNPLMVFISAMLFVLFTNIFYIIVADKSYIWLNLLAQFIILMIVHSFLKSSFTPITLIASFIILLLSYLSYTELEKVQLGSRLFTIGQITKESTTVLLTMITILLSLGLYNTISYNGIEKIFTNNVLENPTIFNKYVLGEKKSDNTLNSAFGISAKNAVSGKPITFGQFLSDHFRNNKDVILDSEVSDIRDKCIAGAEKSQCTDDIILARVKNTRLEEWKTIAYPKITYPLDTPLVDEKFQSVIKQYYINQVCILEKGENCETNKEIPSLVTDKEVATSTKAKISDALTKDINVSNGYFKYFMVDRSNIIPVILTFVLFLFLTIIKGIVGYAIFLVVWLFWQILRIAGFVKIEVETVEAEVVSI
jgi:hypothetical protein